MAEAAKKASQSSPFVAEAAGKVTKTSPFVGVTTELSHTFAEVGVKSTGKSEKEGKMSPFRLSEATESVRVAPRKGSATEHRLTGAAW